MGRDEVGRGGMRWDGTMGLDWIGWDGMGWNGMGRDGIGSDTMGSERIGWVVKGIELDG